MKKAKYIILSLILCAVATVVYAKRKPPEKVTPIMHNGIEYRAPENAMGYVEAWDIKEKKVIWRRQIYVVKYKKGLELDVQLVFISKLKIEGNTLLIENEQKYKYQLDLKTLVVKVLKGSVLIETKL